MRFKKFVEVFSLSMDGVESEITPYSSIYKFKDENVGVNYLITIYNTTNDSELNAIKDNLIKSDIDVKEYGGVGGVYLSHHSDTELSLDDFSRSGLGNHWYVYGKLLSCVQDYVKRDNPLLLKFSGTDSGMDLVYDKMIRMSNKQFPEYSFTYYKGDYYIRSAVYSLMRSKLSSLSPLFPLDREDRARDLARSRRYNNDRNFGRVSSSQSYRSNL